MGKFVVVFIIVHFAVILRTFQILDLFADEIAVGNSFTFHYVIT